MALFKCKMCGGSLEIGAVETVTTCEYCGTQQTLPRLDDERRTTLYDRANHFRRNNEYDKAMDIYEQILNEDKTDAEAYWSLVLCRYGIEYVEDPTSKKRIPTVNRAQFTSVFDDDNYRSALQYADDHQKSIYEAEAKAINEIQKGILAISQKEEPFDVFICYKETDNNGRRTPDSVLANDLYHQLTQEGFKVFFARITLEDKLGSAYEPYIFAALNSAKVMVVLGTKPEFFNAVWVKNEWSRYLALIKQGQKKMLIPAYKDMDPYDLPEEFSHLQAQDMSKLGFMQDLIRGIKKIAAADEPKPSKTTVTEAPANSKTNSLLERAFIFIEDGDFQSGDEYLEKVLDLEPRCGMAYLGKLMVDLKVKKRRRLALLKTDFSDNVNYKRLVRFGSEELIDEVNSYLEDIKSAQQKKEAHEIEVRQQELEQHEQYFTQVTNRYRSIPTENQIKETVKKQKPIKRLLTWGIIFLILYWPIGLILLLVRSNKIKKAIQEENNKYDSVRQEFFALNRQNKQRGIAPVIPKAETFLLTVKAFNLKYDVKMKNGKNVHLIKQGSQISTPLKPGYYSLVFATPLVKKRMKLNLNQNTTIVLNTNWLTGLEPTVE